MLKLDVADARFRNDEKVNLKRVGRWDEVRQNQ